MGIEGLPQGWTQRPILDVAALPNGQVDPRQEPFRSWPLLAPNHIASGSGRWVAVETAEAQRAKSGKYTFEPGDVVYSKIRPYLRKATLVRRRGLCSADMYPLRAGEDLEPGYLLAVLLSDEFTDFAASVSMRTGIPKINRNELSQYQIRLPPLPEQRKIAAILSSVDEVIEKTEAVIEQLQVVKRAMMQELLTRGIPGRHTRFKQTEIGEIPEAWRLATLGDLAESVTSGSRGWAQYYSDDGPLFVRITNLSRGKIEIDLSDTKRVSLPEDLREGTRTRLEPGDVLISITADLGIIGIVRPGLGEAYVNQHIALVRLRQGRAAPGFVARFLSSDAAQHRFRSLNDAGAKAGLNLPSIRRTLVALPSEKEQQEIDRALAGLDAREQREREVLSGLAAVKSALMSALLSGEIRVTPDEQAA